MECTLVALTRPPSSRRAVATSQRVARKRIAISASDNPRHLDVLRNVGRASRLPPSAKATERPRSRGRVNWAGETPALRWRRRCPGAHGAKWIRGDLEVGKFMLQV